jgi:hypothetical protein
MESMEHNLTPGSDTPDDGMSTPEVVAGARARIASPTPDLAQALDKGYEPHDINLRGIGIFLVGLVVTSILVLLMCWGIQEGLVDFDRAGDPIASPVTIDHAPVPQPLQPSWQHNSFDREDMQAMRQETMAVLNSSGTDPKSGRRWIPIDDAMDKALNMLPIQASGEQPGGPANP